jgi:GNAT superfamily N-acetyltransferase
MQGPNRIGPYAVERLDERHTTMVRAHFQQLTREDIRQRFDGRIAARAEEQMVARLGGVDPELYGVIGPDGEVLALLHVATTALTASVRLSVVPKARRQGIAFALLEMAKRIATERGVAWLTALALPDDVPMRNLARLAGMRVSVNDERMLAFLRLARAARRAPSLADAQALA